MEHLSNNHEDHPNQHENSYKLSDETGHPAVMANETTHMIRISQWKESHCRTNTSI